MEASPDSASAVSRRLKIATGLHGAARWILWLIAAGILGVTPWLFGGNSSAGYHWTVWLGRLCIAPLMLWLTACALKKEMPGAAFWVPLVCWSLLAAQIIASTFNKSSVPVAPWLGYGFDAVPHNPHWPSTAFKQATQIEGWFWLSLGLLALAARNVGFGAKPLRALLWILAVTAAVLAVVGIPFKFSGEMLILGKWRAPEWYFYSTFLYHNHWCAFALIGVAAVTALFVSYQSMIIRGGLVLAGGAIAASAPLSTSRLGTLAMSALGLVVLIAFALNKRRPTEPRSLKIPALIATALLGVAVIGGSVVYFYKAHGAPGGHRTWASILSSNPFGIRQQIAEDTLPMIRDKPWFGWGLGGYGGAYRFYQRAETRIVHNEGRVTLYDHPHNDWLERLTELGLIGFSLFLAPGIVWLTLAWRHRPLGSAERWMLVGCFGLLLFALGDMVFVNRAVAASFALLLPAILTVKKPVAQIRESLT